MEIRLLEKKKEENKISFILKDTDYTFANLIRRVIMDEVPTMAIRDVEFRRNNSILYDDIIAHRLGLIPLSTDLKSYNILEKCKCEGKGCARCQLKLVLKQNKIGVVYSSDMQSKDPGIKPVFPNIPIVKLLKGQDLELEATATLGKGKSHVKWSPGLVYYKYKPVIEILKEPKNAQEIVDSCPKKIFEIKNNKLSINKDNLLNCHFCEACLSVGDNSIKVSEKKEEIIFYIESFGQLDCKKILLEAGNIIEEDMDEFASLIKKS